MAVKSLELLKTSAVEMLGAYSPNLLSLGWVKIDDFSFFVVCGCTYVIGLNLLMFCFSYLLGSMAIELLTIVLVP